MRHTDRTFAIAAAGCFAAALLFAFTLVRAFAVNPSPEPQPADPLVSATAHSEQPPLSHDDASEAPDEESEAPLVREGAVAVTERPLSMDALLLAVENDPFQESRQRPPERYRMPGDPIEFEGPPPPPPPPPFQVLGIAQRAGGGIAVMQIEDTPPRVLSVGESLFGYTLDRVDGEVATLSGQGRVLTLTVAQASPNPVLEEEARSSRRGRARNAEEAIERLRGRRDGDSDVEQVREMQQNAVEMIRRMMEQQQRGNNRRGNNDGSSVVFPPPWMVDGNRTTGIPLQRGRIILRADTNTTAAPSR